MRRMRGGFWSYIWFGVPALAAAVIGYGVFTRARHPVVATHIEAANTEVTIEASEKHAGARTKAGARAPASFMEKFGSKFSKLLAKGESNHDGIHEVTHEGKSDGKSPAVPLAKNGHAEVESDEGEEESLGYAMTPGPASRTIAQASEGAAPTVICDRSEARGTSPETAQVSKKDWVRVIDSFHTAKRELTAWLGRQEFPKPIAEVLAARVNALKIQRPPAVEEPDLSWRGIGVFTTSAETPLIRVGSGFVRRLAEKSELARFEMTRLVAQVWAPCELERHKVAALWTPLLKCLGLPTEACTDGSNSESGWAVSTSLSFAVHPPGAGCPIPAFADPKSASCLNAWKPLAATSGSKQHREVASEPWEKK